MTGQMTGLRITIVTFAWPPRNSIGAHRPWSWAKYWSAAGARVRVLTARKYAYDAPLDLDLPALPGVEVIETDYASTTSALARLVGGTPLEPAARWLWRRLRARGQAPRNPRAAWFPALRPQLAALALDCDVVVSTYDPAEVHLIAAEMKRANPRLRWIADYRDLWGENHTAAWTPAERAAEAARETASVGALADVLTSVSADLAAQLQARHGKPAHVITNGFDLDAAALRAALAAPRPAPARGSRPLRIVYTGKIYPGLRDPGPLLATLATMEAAGEIAPGAVELHLYGSQAEVDVDPALRRFLVAHGHVPRAAAMAAQRTADLLLLLESPAPEARGVLTGKIFEYMASGVPVLSLGSGPDSAIAAVLGETGTGLCAGADRGLIGAVLRGALAGAAPAWYRPDLAAILRYSREAQARLLYDLLAAPPPARRDPPEAA